MAYLKSKGHPLGPVWANMRQRCSNPANPKYHRYGARGIWVCDRWENFAYFVEDMGPRPEGYFLDRIDNDGPYTPENCRWTTGLISGQNKSYNPKSRMQPCSTFITYKGETKALKEWALILDIKYPTLYKRLTAYGWSVEKAFNRRP